MGLAKQSRLYPGGNGEPLNRLLGSTQHVPGSIKAQAYLICLFATQVTWVANRHIKYA